MNQHRTLAGSKPIVTSEVTDQMGVGGREGRLHPGLIAGTVVFLSVGAATFAFWYVVTTTGFVNLNEGALFVVRGAGLLGLMLGILGLFVVVGSFRRAALPIADLLVASERVASGEYDLEVTEQGPREIRVLTRAFNAMADMLKTRDAAERRLATEIARELVTSVNKMMQSLDALAESKDEQLPIARERAERLSRLIQDVNTLSLAKNGELSLAPEATDLCVLVPDTISSLHREASARGVALRADVPDPALFFVTDPRRFRQALKCLLLNALERSPENSDIQVELSELRKPTQVQLKVTDHGTAIPPEELPFILEHMTRSNEIGTGLELVLINQLVQAQKGELLAASSEDMGTSFTVLLPPDTPRV